MIRCPSCGEENPARFRHCGYCGAELAQSSPLRETRKTVTILFTDVTGSTALGERLDPESLRDVMGRYFASMREVIERHGGTVEKYIGDSVMAVFGVPLVHEEDALRAVRAAIEMRLALERLNADLLPRRGVALEARTGINTGPVVVGAGGPVEAIVVGDAVNVAARLQTSAAPGEILIGVATHELVRDAVEVGPAEPLDLKGKAEPVVAYRLEQVAAGAEGHRRRVDAPMVGRERELDALTQAFDRAVSSGSCQLFTILGSAGVGKSRLVAEFLGTVRDSALVVRGRCLPYGEGITYLPAAEIVRQAAGVEDSDSSEMARERIDSFAADLPEGAAIARGLIGLIGLEASAAQEELVWAFRRALEHLADRRPLIVLVDDIHWAEPTLLDLVESVSDLARDSPILFVCPARPEFLDERPTWGGGKLNATTILLEPLAEGPAFELIDALVPGALPPQVRERIVRAAEGNPLFVEEFVGMLIDEGVLVADRDGWAADRDLGSIAVPPTIQALLSARLDRLAPDERTVAERASVVGRTFDQPSVVALSPATGRSEVPRNLLALVRKELIRPDRSGLARGEAFRFRHMLIRDAAYERLPKTERAELHELFAGWLEVTAGDRVSEVEEVVGYHLEQAYRYRQELAPIDGRARDLARRAAAHLITAGSRALERSDIGATVNLFGRAEKLLDPTDPARLAILPDLGRALAAEGRSEDAKACLAEAVERSRALGDKRAIAHARIVQSLSGDVVPETSADDMRRIAEECSATFEELGDDRGLSLVWRLRGEASWRDGNAAGEEVALGRALEHARRAGSHWEEHEIVLSLSIDLYWGPTPVTDAIRRCNDLLAGAPDDRAIELGITHALAHMHARLGEFEVARSFAARCLEIATESGERIEAAALTEVAADVETLAGDHDAAERVLAAGCDWFLANGGPHEVLEALHGLAQVAAGHPVDVQRLAEMAAGTSRASRALLGIATAAAHLSAGSLLEAERDARSAIAFFATTDFITFHANGAVVLGDVLRAAGRREEATAAFQQALDLYRRKGSQVSVASVAARLAG